jgi:hypothetical protein
MSLLRLLTAGKSLIGVRESAGRYQLPSARVLPKFGSKKNPFRATVIPEKAEPAGEVGTPSPEGPPAQGTVAGDPVRAPTGARAERDGARNDLTIGRSNNNNSGTHQPGGPSDHSSQRASGVRAFLLWRRAKKARPFSGRTEGPMVQGELSLDGIQVVRNDLSESDLEVVRANPADSKSAPALTGTGAGLSGPEVGWGAVAGRFLGLGNM